MSQYPIDAPQLGEHAWHAFTDDANVAAESVAHAERIEAVIRLHAPKLDWRSARILEIGAYRHYTGHLLGAARGCEFVASDLSAAALRGGRREAERNGVATPATLVAADFHDLPFSSGYFDAVFVKASVHHTRTPEIVLREMLRVLKPDGLLLLDNEPCARLCCFYAFAANREESLTPFEARLRDAGLLQTLSQPFWGSRPEQLFGMVENDRIPLSLYQELFDQEGTVLERTLSPDRLMGPFEARLLAMTSRGRALEREVRDALREAVAFAQSAYGDTERLLGHRLPTECDVHALASSVARVLERRDAYASADEWQALLFGAALRAVVRKRSGPQRDVALFRREMITESDGLVREARASALGAPLLPDLPTCEDGALLAPWFSPEEWRWYRADNGVRTMANLAPQCRVEIAPQTSHTILLVRYHAVVTDDRPFRVRLWAAGRVLADQFVVLQEERLIRTVLPAQCPEVLFDLAAEDDAPFEAAWHIRVGVFQQFAIA
jgi:SAM-dependent methyltransferase